MAISVTNVGTSGNTVGATLAVTVGVGGVPAGCLIFVAVAESNTNASSGTVADNAGNTYTSITSASLNNVLANGRATLYYVKNATALVNTNTITYTKQTSGVQTAMTVLYATGIDVTAPLDTAVTASATGSSTTPSVTSGTPAVSGELIVGTTMSTGNTGAFTQGAGFATPPNEGTNGTGGTDRRVNGGNLVNAGTGTSAYSPTYGASHSWACFIVGFKPDVGSVSMSAAVGDFALSGVAAVLNTSLVSAAGSYALTGIAASFNTSMIEAVGTFALTGVAAAFGVSMPVPAAAFTFTGISASFNIAMPAAVASYAFNGVASGLNIAMTANAGSYSLHGVDVDLVFTSAPNTYRRAFANRDINGRPVVWKGVP